ncbi:hypothetical protein [Flavobacterium sp.]|uniref:hypothetical protein n=1 Tax=Flavobacterium sp. TaxID=239 RepID=UPI00120838B0|nr:hypothetical protein [Flavobacterium sp.]RZJ71069.1 MAG: hypothetical protein EOO49_11490 [Flavobacterium sp.]
MEQYHYTGWDVSKFTLDKIMAIMKHNLRTGAELKAEFKKRIINGKCTGILYNYGVEIWRKEYTHEFEMVNSAYMQVDFYFLLWIMKKMAATGGINHIDKNLASMYESFGVK